jgi:hypothetical protein
MKTSEKTDKIYEAIFNTKKQLTSVAKSSDNPFFKSKYADLNAHLDVAEPILQDNGCIVFQPANVNDAGVNSVETRIVHVASQQFVSSEMALLVGKNTMQDLGSAVTYARRYTLGSLLSMKAEDDDGNKVSQEKLPVKTHQYSKPKEGPKSGTSSTQSTSGPNVEVNKANPVAEMAADPTPTATPVPVAAKPSVFRNKNLGAKAAPPVATQPLTPAPATSGEWK